MKIIINRYIPFKGYIAMTFFNIIFWRQDKTWLLTTNKKDVIVNHESIHEALMRDFCKWLPLGGLIFYILYLIEWIYRLFVPITFMSFKKAYRSLSFEREAKEYEQNLEYLQTRKKFNEYNFI